MQITEKEMRNRLKLDTKNDLIDKLIMAYMTIRQSQEKREQAIATVKADADRLADVCRILKDRLAVYEAGSEEIIVARAALKAHEEARND